LRRCVMVFWVDLFASMGRAAMRRAQLVLVTLLWVIVSQSLSRSVAAQTTPYVDVPADCGSQAAFLTEVAALQRTTAARLTVSELVIAHNEDGPYELRLVSTEGARILTDRDCRTLFKTATVIAATMAEQPPLAPVTAAAGDNGETVPRLGPTAETPLEPVAEPPPQPARPTPTPANASAPAGLPREQDSRGFAYSQKPSQQPRQLATLQLGAGAAGWYGLSPSPHVGLEALAGLTAKRWGGHVAVRLLPPRSMLIRDELGLRQTVFGARISAARLLTEWLRLSLGLTGYW